ncbi:MAG TPA: helix-turn-helix domain-containing protein [Gaiellales bacterium]|nr:helix-turn-helix domain-containing protein [Gaiellales bacterium]
MAGTRRNWTFLTNHAAVLVCIAGNPDSRIEDIASEVGISRRAAQMIVGDLVADRYIERRRIGRRNQYRVHAEMPLRRRPFQDRDVRTLIGLLAGRDTPRG